MLLRMPDKTLFTLLAAIQIVLMVEVIHPTDLCRQKAENQQCTQESCHLIPICWHQASTDDGTAQLSTPVETGIVLLYYNVT